MMLISELSFPHLQAAHDERLAQELERRRVVQERLAESPAPRRRRGVARTTSSERMPRAAVATTGRAPGAEPCPA